MADERSKKAIDVLEGYVDQAVSEGEFLAASRGAADVDGPRPYPVPRTAAYEAASAAVYAAYRNASGIYDAAWSAAFAMRLAHHDSPGAEKMEYVVQCSLLRDIFGNPFRPVSVDSSWQIPIVLHLAQAAYDERSLPIGTLHLGHLAILADALEDAGCESADVLSHLRGPGPHVRGCWALDLILGNE